jgi:3',5'-cyclic AMP phosphodiesterase CpdA
LVAHLTDLHVADVRDYVDAEAALHPKIRKHSERILVRLLADLASRKPDHVVITGDLTQTAKEEEFRRTRAHLDAALPGVRLSVLPGNHDVWREQAVREGWLARSFGDAVACDLGGTGFPYCHLVGPDLAVIGLDSCPYQPGMDPARTPGRIDPGQLERLMRKVVEGNVRVELKALGIEDLSDSLSTSSNRISIALIVGAIIVGSSLIVSLAILVKFLYDLSYLGD